MKLPAILSIGTSRYFRVFYRNLKNKETAVIFKYIDQLSPNSARVHNLVHSFDNKSIKIFHSSYCLHCSLVVRQLSFFCSNSDALSEVQEVLRAK